MADSFLLENIGRAQKVHLKFCGKRLYYIRWPSYENAVLSSQVNSNKERSGEQKMQMQIHSRNWKIICSITKVWTLLNFSISGENCIANYPDQFDFFLHVISRFFVHFLSFTFLLSSFVFLCHSHLSFWIPLSSLLLALAVSGMQLKKNEVSAFQYFLVNSIAVIILILPLLIMAHLYDISYDGQTYHQFDIFMMKNGWNPFYQKVADFISENGIFPGLWSRWSDVYVKYAETVSANLYLMTGHIQSGKALIILLGISCFFETYVLLHKWYLNRFFAILFALAFCLNPVGIAQYTTFYVDGILYYAFLLLVLYLLRLETDKKINSSLYFDIVLVALTLSNIKLLGFFYASILLGGYWISTLIRKQWRRVYHLLISGICLLLLCILTGISPYYTNIKNGCHILHPFMGNQKIDIMTGNTPVILRPLSPPKRLFYSFFSYTCNNRNVNMHPKKLLKFPFSIVAADEPFYTYDMRIGGFGWLWSGIFLSGLFLGGIGLFFSSEQKRAILLLGSLILLTAIGNPESWWARYVPQFWLLPIFAALLLLSGIGKIKKTRYVLSFLFLLTVFINTGIIFNHATRSCIRYTKATNYVISQMKPHKSHHKIAIQNGLCASLYTFWDHGITCDPCSAKKIPDLKKRGYKSADCRELYFIHPGKN